MATVIVDQTIRIILETNTDLTNAGSPKILYQKPDGTEANWTASISGTTLVFDVESKEIDIAGWWHFHSSVIFAGDANPSFGKRATQQVKDQFER